jgi:hypothetical protein
MPAHVDIVVLTRDARPYRADVREAIESQTGVFVHVFRVIGSARQGDAHRWQTISRARNEGKRHGSSPWLMFVDDDVVLGPNCVASLLEALQARPEFAAFGADYDREMKPGRGNWDYPGHVGMGATLFRRERLESLTFRWESAKCECQCCCDDLRRAGYGIGYHTRAVAWHKRMPSSERHSATTTEVQTKPRPQEPGRVLAAFDRHHLTKFKRQFLQTLRACGNRETVTAVTYGLRPSEVRLLARTPGVDVVARPSVAFHPGHHRVADFQAVVADWPENTPVAYWDAADVLFQCRLEALWKLVHENPEKILAVREPTAHPENPAVASWISVIKNPEARRRTFELLSTRPFLNSGFVAASASTMRHYLVEAQGLMDAGAVRIDKFGADQLLLNIFCHSDPNAWKEIPEGWNFCLCNRNPREFRVRFDGRIESKIGTPVYVVHGNAGTLRHVEWYYNFLAAASGD